MQGHIPLPLPPKLGCISPEVCGGGMTIIIEPPPPPELAVDMTEEVRIIGGW